MTTKGRLSGLPTELGFARHLLPVGEFEDLGAPGATVSLEGDGVIEHFEATTGAEAETHLGGARSRSILFICKERPKYAVHTLLAPERPGSGWKGWIDRYETWSVLVEGHPEFGHRDVRGRRLRMRPEPVPPEVHTGPAEAEDASSSFL